MISLKIRSNSRISIWTVAVVVLLFNYFGFRVLNFYWYSFYLCVGGFFALNSFKNIGFNLKGNKLRTKFLLETKVIVGFMICSIFSLIVNKASIIDGVFVLIQRLTPLVFLILIYNYTLYSDVQKMKRKTDVFLTVFQPMFFALFFYALFQAFILNYRVDLLGSFTGHAHSYSFLAFFLNLLFFQMTKKKWLYLIVFFGNLILAVLGDYKLGLISFFGAFLLSSFLMNFKKNKKKFIAIMLIGFSFVSLILIFLDKILSVLPSHYSEIFYLIDQLSGMEWLKNTQSVFPNQLELFKGYYQLFSEVLNTKPKLILGVGSGNYASNIAMMKEKYYAQTYVIHFSDILKAKGFGNGTLLSRDGWLINLIAEFGLAGSFVYLFVLIRLLIFPFKYLKSTKLDKKAVKSFFPYLVLVIFCLFEMPVFPIFSEGLNVSVLAIFGVILISETRSYEG